MYNVIVRTSLSGISSLFLVSLLLWFLQTESSCIACTSNKCRAENQTATNTLTSPQKRTSSRTPAGTPSKRQNVSPSADKSPRKFPASPAGSRAGLRSGSTPQKLRQTVTTPKKNQSPPEDDAHSEEHSPSPQKRTSSRAPAGTPAKRQNVTPPAKKSPQKFPVSPADPRPGLRSGSTPQKLRQIVTVPKKSQSPAGINFSSEESPPSVKCSPGKSTSDITNGNLESTLLSTSLGKTPLKQLAVVLKREEYPVGNSSSPPSVSPHRKPSHPKFPASPVTTRTGMRSSEDSPRRQILSPTKRGTPKKSSHVPVENGASLESKTRSTVNSDRNTSAAASRRLWESSGAEEETLPSVRHCIRPPVVIVLEDFECFRSQLLQDLITICG